MRADVRHQLKFTFLDSWRAVAPKSATAIRAWDRHRERDYFGHGPLCRHIVPPCLWLTWIRNKVLNADLELSSYRNLTPYLASGIYHVHC